MHKRKHIVHCENCGYWVNLEAKGVSFCTKLCKTKIENGKVVPQTLFCDGDDYCWWGCQIGYPRYEFEPGELEALIKDDFQPKD